MADVFNPSYPTYYGFELNSTTKTGYTINNSTVNYVAAKIVPNVSKTVNTLYAYLLQNGTALAQTIELRTDSSGSPSGTVLQSNTLSSPTNNALNSVSITNQAVTAGTPYWIVVSGSLNNGVNNVGLNGVDDPDGLLVPSVFNTKTSTDNSTWSNKSQMAGAGFGFTDVTYFGNPYVFTPSNNAENINNSNSRWGEYFNPPITFTASAISFKVQLDGGGSTNQPLLYNIQNADTSSSLASSTLIASGGGTTSWVWYTQALSPQIVFNSGTNYRVYVSSANSGAGNWQIQGMQSTSDAVAEAMGFGGTNAVATQFGGPTQFNILDFPFRLTLSTSTGISNLAALGVG